VRSHVADEGEKGEWCFAILLPQFESETSEHDDSSDWVKTLACMLNISEEIPPLRASEAAQRVSQYFGIPKKVVYEKALRISGKKS
jgi:hypothetical protein